MKDVRLSYERKMETNIVEINESLSKITTKMVTVGSTLDVWFIHNNWLTPALSQHAQLFKMENQVSLLKDTYKRLVDLQGKQFADTSPLYATCPMLNFGKAGWERFQIDKNAGITNPSCQLNEQATCWSCTNQNTTPKCHWYPTKVCVTVRTTMKDWCCSLRGSTNPVWGQRTYKI